MAKFRGEFACDSCSVACDADPIDLIGREEIPSGLSSDKVDELTYFWLCADCAPDYPKGARDFFIEDYFEVVPLCAECGDEEVEAEGHFCDYCDALS